MDLLETQIFEDEASVTQRLRQMQVEKAPLLNARNVAYGASGDATPLHAANAPGTFAYHHGLYALRDGLVGEIWKPDRTDGIETVKNEELRIRIGFSNVDIACHLEPKPKPRSSKGVGAERACTGNLFGYLPEYVPRHRGGWFTYYLMVDEDGRAELSLPIVKANTFHDWVERIFLSDGSDLHEPMNTTEDSDEDTFEPAVTRKTK